MIFKNHENNLLSFAMKMDMAKIGKIVYKLLGEN